MLFFVKQKTAYEMRISDWSSDVCSSDLRRRSVRTPSSSPLPSLVPCAFPPIMPVRTLFATHFYEADIGDPDLLEDLEQSCRLLAVEDGAGRDRKSVVSGKSVSVRVDLGGRRIIKKKNKP